MPNKFKKMRPKKRNFRGRRKYKLTRASDNVQGNTSLVNMTRLGGRCPIPRRYVCKMRYSDVIAYAGGGVHASIDNVFRLNGIFDVDLTGAGHQPRYYDQFVSLYNRYRVLGVKVTAKILSTQSTLPQQNLWCSIHANNTTTKLDGEDYWDMQERPYSKTLISNLYMGNASSITKSFSTSKVGGVKSINYDIDYSSGIGGLPTKLQYLHILVGNPDPTILNWSAQMALTMEFIVSWEEPVIPPFSI